MFTQNFPKNSTPSPITNKNRYQIYRLPSYSSGNSENNKIVLDELNCIIKPNPQFQGECGGLYLGNLEGAVNQSLLQKLNIKAVLTVACEVNLTYTSDIISFHKSITADDVHTYDLISNFEEAFQFINSIHCYAGVSRSATIIIAYMMKHYNMSFENAFQFVREKRKIIYPNPGFLEQLREFRKYLDQMNPKKNNYEELEKNQTIFYMPNANFYSQQIIDVSPSKRDNENYQNMYNAKTRNIR